MLSTQTHKRSVLKLTYLQNPSQQCYTMHTTQKTHTQHIIHTTHHTHNTPHTQHTIHTNTHTQHTTHDTHKHTHTTHHTHKTHSYDKLSSQNIHIGTSLPSSNLYVFRLLRNLGLTNVYSRPLWTPRPVLTLLFQFTHCYLSAN